MYEPKSIFVKIAFDTICNHVSNIEKIVYPDTIFKDTPELNDKLACFVSIHKQDESLRGCIGTIEPARDCLLNEIIENAISAAIHDPRFSEVKENELDNLEVSVDVLSAPVRINDISELDPSTKGIIVADGYRKGVLLPNLDSVDTVEKQLDITKRKAGIYQSGIDGLDIFTFTSTRYH